VISTPIDTDRLPDDGHATDVEIARIVHNPPALVNYWASQATQLRSDMLSSKACSAAMVNERTCGVASVGPKLPREKYPGAIPTLNGRGFMLKSLDPYSSAFVDYAGSTDAPVLDMGCAYGVATLAALAKGASVCACDMDAGHLAILEDCVPGEQRPRLTTQIGMLPDVDFQAHSFGAILASRVLHFLTGDDVERAMKKMAAWLKPGGQMFLIADTPYMRTWSASVPAYEKRKREGHKWPGFLPDFSKYVPDGTDPTSHPEFLNPMDPDILARLCNEVGLNVIRTGFMGLQRGGSPVQGNEHAGCEAFKAIA
jgi:SAM-dependent methyltransferase